MYTIHPFTVLKRTPHTSKAYKISLSLMTYVHVKTKYRINKYDTILSVTLTSPLLNER